MNETIIETEEPTILWYMSEEFRDYFYMGEMQLIYLLLILMFIDIVTGLSKAFINKNLWSRKSLFGFARKMIVFLIIITSNVIDTLLDLNGILVYATVLFYIVNEALSIVENSAQLGLPIPEQITKALDVMRETDRFDKEFKPKERGNKNDEL